MNVAFRALHVGANVDFTLAGLQRGSTFHQNVGNYLIDGAWATSRNTKIHHPTCNLDFLSSPKTCRCYFPPPILHFTREIVVFLRKHHKVSLPFCQWGRKRRTFVVTSSTQRGFVIIIMIMIGNKKIRLMKRLCHEWQKALRFLLFKST